MFRNNGDLNRAGKIWAANRWFGAERFTSPWPQDTWSNLQDRPNVGEVRYSRMFSWSGAPSSQIVCCNWKSASSDGSDHCTSIQIRVENKLSDLQTWPPLLSWSYPYFYLHLQKVRMLHRSTQFRIVATWQMVIYTILQLLLWHRTQMVVKLPILIVKANLAEIKDYYYHNCFSLCFK
jgi:hypothetical protein